MALTFELAQFTVREGEEAALLAERPEMVRALQQAFPTLAAWLTKQDDGSWLDVILWRSRQAAEEAARRIDSLPEARSWFRHIAESHCLRHAEVVHERLFAYERTGQPVQLWSHASCQFESKGHSMPQPDTAEVIKTFNDAFVERDPDKLVHIVADECVMESTQPAPNGTRYEGYDACLRFWQELIADPNGSFRPEDVVVSGDRATIRWRYRFGEGDENSVRGVNLMHVRDGKIVEALGYVKAGLRP